MINVLVPAIATLLNKVIPDKDKAQEIAHELATLTEKQAHELALAQIEVNKNEAAHKSLFVAGWRPAAAWCCVSGMAINYVVLPICRNFDLLANVTPLNMSEMMPVLMGMLGLGSFRSWEKSKGIAREK